SVPHKSSLVGTEPKQLVAHNRSAGCTTKLVALQIVRLGREKVARVYCAVADELKGRAVELVGARTSHYVDHRSGEVAVLSRVVRRLYGEFLHCIGVWISGIQVGDVIHMGGAVESIIHFVASCAI